MAAHSSLPVWRIPMDRGAWQTTVHWVAKSRTQLRRLSTHTCLTEEKSCSGFQTSQSLDPLWGKEPDSIHPEVPTRLHVKSS